jgi:hypothetical protein
MHVENAKAWNVLRRIVAGLSMDLVLRQDMMQECLLWLSRVERERPGHTMSWYLRNCRFHLQHWLASGRSVDSLKRSGHAQKVHIDEVVDDGTIERIQTNGDPMEEIFARDIISSLLRHLRPPEQKVLHGLARGLTLREVASELDLSYPTALRYRRKIARLVTKLNSPLLAGRRPKALNQPMKSHAGQDGRHASKVHAKRHPPTKRKHSRG